MLTGRYPMWLVDLDHFDRILDFEESGSHVGLKQQFIG